MKNKIITLLVLSILLTIVVGCSFSENLEKTISGTNEANSSNANKSLTDRAIETAVGDEKIGVPECDDLLERFADIAQAPDDNYVSKGTRQYVLSKIRENIKRSIEENKNDKTQMAKDCKEYRGQLDKFKSQEETNKQTQK
jgi:hypothetical protein